MYGNPEGDWTGCIASQENTSGNFSSDPLLCSVSGGDWALRSDDSPCAPANNSCAVLVGALDVGCSCNCGVWSDVTGDGKINPVDVVFMVNFVYKELDQRTQPPRCSFEGGDVNCDSKVNPLDVVHYANYVYKNITTFPCIPCPPQDEVLEVPLGAAHR